MFPPDPPTSTPVLGTRRRTLVLLAPVLACWALVSLPAGGAAQEVVDPPSIVMGGLPFTLTIRADESAGEPTGDAAVDGDGAVDGAAGESAVVPYEVRSSGGASVASGALAPGASGETVPIRLESASELPLEVVVGNATLPLDLPFAPGWFSLLPPLIAIGMALVFREVLSALFAGIWLGCLAVAGWNPVSATGRLIDTYVVPALADDGGHAQIVIFSFLLGGMVGVIAKNGGTLGIVEAVSPFADSRRKGKIATWLAGLAIFFDDYANTLIVGNTMRPITDRLRISREKLAYLVDSTAAPVAAIVPISTWVGYEISLIGDGFRIAAEQPGLDPVTIEGLAAANPFTVFLHTIPYLFYPLLALALVFLTSVMNRDFGAMADAEARAAGGGGLYREGAVLATDTAGEAMAPIEGAPRRWWNAALPVLTVILVVLAGLWVTGSAGLEAGARAATSFPRHVMDVFGAADPFATLLWGSLAGVLVAVGLSVAQRILTLRETMDALVGGMRAMMIAMIILVLAWSLGAITETLGTAQYLSGILSGGLPLQLIPVLVFVTAAAIAFATGTSWGTMAILIPLIVPLVVSLGGGVDFDGGERYTVLLGSISSVLAGAIFGDHCSPISDTTVLSSTAAGCDHVDHVRTQLPYALLVAGVGMTLGDIPTAFGMPNWISLVAGVVVLWGVLRMLGRPAEATPVPEEVREAVPQ